jgi:hypothetical protein
MDECRMGHFDTEENPADLAMKVIHGSYKRDHLVSKVLHYIAPGDDE